MHVQDLLQLDSLDLTLLWAEGPLLTREISGVTGTELEDPASFVQPGELVLSGLVWWTPGDSRAKADRFVSALHSAGATALLAGEETHGTVPDVLVESCRELGIALIAVPAHTTFRAITEAVYLRQWGDPSRRPGEHYALPEKVRTELAGLIAGNAAPDALLDGAFAHLGGPPCYLLTATGRVIARTPAAPHLPAQRAARELTSSAGTILRIGGVAGPYDGWQLHLRDAADAPPRVLHEIAEVMAQYRHRVELRQAAERRAADELIALTGAGSADAAALQAALHACGLPPTGPYRVVAASGGADGDEVVSALAEALRHSPGVPFAVGRVPGGEAVAVVRAHPDAGDGLPLGELWPLVHACRPQTPLHAGVSGPVPAPDGLNSALDQARYALAAARAERPDGARVTSVEDLSTLGALLAGVPAVVRTAFSNRVLGPLARAGSASHRMLLETLEVFLTHHGSWARTAETLHLHVNTVHYRIQRIETLTGRDLSRLEHKLDLQAALLCR
ncbi:PucR family transcriptional regulator [Streptomyces decoyicus]|uniref:PucR family transcriptional regulator n=1 Tax=Streptomyces decoyicus TaxID=249567 RepID=UPI00069E13A6|nr:helix-turn-helix domain-containing protein [Streptomyces decoyicus]KOG46933.1 transcriptional regulator, PucR family protein [Streptomyces decoyicus]QZY14472.1 helix-turn-helix domain-containing protein [Streptomyces decoyicus]